MNKEFNPQPQGLQGEFNLGVDRQQTSEELMREELVGKVHNVLLLYAERAIYPLYDKVRKGEGKQILSSTEEGRPGEELLDIDQTGENVLKSIIRETKLSAVLVSENSPEPHVFENGDFEKVYIFADPFDNTSQYKRGLDTPPYTVISIFDNKGNPMGAVVGDIKNRKAYMCLGKETFIIDIKDRINEEEKYTKKKVVQLTSQKELLEKIIESQASNIENPNNTIKLKLFNSFIGDQLDYKQSQRALAELEKEYDEARKKEHKREKIVRSERTTLKDRNSTLATFIGEKEYSLKFFKYFGKLVQDMHPKGLVYGGGGAYIYGFLASGAIDAYVMFDEPVSEIIPGLPLALAAGCTAVSVNEDGTFEDFKFSPNALKENHRLYSEGSIPLLIAAATPEIRDEIIRYYLEAKNKIKKTEELIAQ